MSDTPRSDVIEKSAKEVYVGYAYTSALELARDLERELAAEKAKVARLREAGQMLINEHEAVVGWFRRGPDDNGDTLAVMQMRAALKEGT